MSLARSHLVFPAVIVLTLMMALLPAPSRLGWSRELGELVRFPLMPFTHAGNALASWLRPPPAATGMPEEVRPYVDALNEEKDRALALYHAEHQRVLELEEQLRQIQSIPAETLRMAVASAVAHVTARSPESPFGPVTVKLARGWGRPIPVGTVAVYGGAHLLGRVVDRPSGSEAFILPLPSKGTRYIRGRVLPANEPLKPLEQGALVQLTPTGAGVFEADMDQAIPVADGDIVRLQDESWPPTAQGLVIGRLESIEVDDEEPLRNTIRVRPFYDVQSVAYVTLIIDDAEGFGSEDAP